MVVEEMDNDSNENQNVDDLQDIGVLSVGHSDNENNDYRSQGSDQHSLENEEL